MDKATIQLMRFVILLAATVLIAPISKAAVQRCISKLSPYWDDEQLEAVVSMFKAHCLR